MNRFAGLFLGWALVVGLSFANQWIFTRFFDTSYVAWFIANGSLFGVITSIVGLAWGEINRHLGLISAHPLDYLGSYLQLAGIPLFEMGTHLRTDSAARGTRSSFDLIVAGIMASLVSLVILAWILVVVPLQYFLYLVCGAPARVFARSERRVVARFRKGVQVELREVDLSEKLSDEWWAASLTSKPVAFTGMLAAVLLGLIKLAM